MTNSPQPKTIIVDYAWENVGFCRTYYRTRPDGQLICRQEESWFTVNDDGIWYEPVGDIDEDKYDIVIADKPLTVEEP